ncbi:MAG: metal-dependent transcriptional regulator [Saprospiraceae bacterium]|nr:metal-dependent transcriptional regulator [Saprospiraceae bacterium]MBK7811480.1 metal-dependent transcriptional regulator [Saprospiraceae bacterium]MBK9631261.1 metal-dependent transcriptional regulator [Saprospiraceae bacterium]
MDLNLLSLTDENYLKAIYQLCEQNVESSTSTNELALFLNLKPGTITESIRRLSDKGLIAYEKYQPLRLTIIGKSLALQIIRKQRLWKTWLVKKMAFGWEEIDDLAHQLEHIRSIKLIDKLDEILGFPLFDPHGDPIPDSKGNVRGKCFISLDRSTLMKSYRITAINDQSEKFIKYMDKLGLKIGDRLVPLDFEEYDQAITISLNDQQSIMLPKTVSENILITSELHCCAFENQQSNPPCLNYQLQN